MPSRTTTALLDGLADASNSEAWGAFDARYRPVLTRFGVRLGLSRHDAEELAQEALSRFVVAYQRGRYDRERGRLHSWLIGIARHCLLDMWDARRGGAPAPAGSILDRMPNEQGMTVVLREACETEVLRLSLEELRRTTRTEERTIRAFELLLSHGSPAGVAARLGMTVDEVYVAKHRCLRRLRPIVARIEDDFELGEAT
jgi:DNA-directed RNA polymerase specialized sigma24 family protein